MLHLCHAQSLFLSLKETTHVYVYKESENTVQLSTIALTLSPLSKESRASWYGYQLVQLQEGNICYTFSKIKGTKTCAPLLRCNVYVLRCYVLLHSCWVIFIAIFSERASCYDFAMPNPYPFGICHDHMKGGRESEIAYRGKVNIFSVSYHAIISTQRGLMLWHCHAQSLFHATLDCDGQRTRETVNQCRLVTCHNGHIKQLTIALDRADISILPCPIPFLMYPTLILGW